MSTMKLYHRTNYWGSKIKAQQRNFSPYAYIECQAVANDNIDRRFSGCCQHLGERVVEVRDEQIKEAYDGKWELFHTSTCLGREGYFHYFFLIPEPQVTHKGNGWTRVGSVDANNALDEMEPLLYPFEQDYHDKFNKENVSAVCRHVHILLVMSTLSEVHGKFSPLKSYVSRSRYNSKEKKLAAKSSIRVTVV